MRWREAARGPQRKGKWKNVSSGLSDQAEKLWNSHLPIYLRALELNWKFVASLAEENSIQTIDFRL